MGGHGATSIPPSFQLRYNLSQPCICNFEFRGSQIRLLNCHWISDFGFSGTQICSASSIAADNILLLLFSGHNGEQLRAGPKRDLHDKLAPSSHLVAQLVCENRELYLQEKR